MGGYRYATAVGSDITGFGADEIIIDDPVQPEDALSERVKQQLRDWVNSSVYTRFNDPSQGNHAGDLGAQLARMSGMSLTYLTVVMRNSGVRRHRHEPALYAENRARLAWNLVVFPAPAVRSIIRLEAKALRPLQAEPPCMSVTRKLQRLLVFASQSIITGGSSADALRLIALAIAITASQTSWGSFFCSVITAPRCSHQGCSEKENVGGHVDRLIAICGEPMRWPCTTFAGSTMPTHLGVAPLLKTRS